MLLFDRVICDLCRVYLGQLYNQAAQSSNTLIDKRHPPYLCLCPDCWDNSAVQESK